MTYAHYTQLSVCFAQIIAEQLRRSFQYGHRLLKVDFETEVGQIIVLRDIVYENSVK